MPVVETVATGDTFTGSPLDGLLAESCQERLRDDLQRVDARKARRILSKAVCAAATTVGRRCANPPMHTELVSAEFGLERV